MRFQTTRSLLKRIIEIQETIMAALDTLTADVTANTSVTNSAIALINNLAAEITAAGTDPVALKALTDKLEANSAALAGAVTANTPAAPPAPAPTA
jgi:hypothetical protein